MNNLVKIKFCGMSKKKDIEIALKLGVDWIGIIYVKTSPRYVDFKKSDFISSIALIWSSVSIYGNVLENFS